MVDMDGGAATPPAPAETFDPLPVAPPIPESFEFSDQPVGPANEPARPDMTELADFGNSEDVAATATQ